MKLPVCPEGIDRFNIVTCMATVSKNVRLGFNCFNVPDAVSIWFRNIAVKYIDGVIICILRALMTSDLLGRAALHGLFEACVRYKA